MPWPCVWVEPSGMSGVQLRRLQLSEETRADVGHFHEASVPLDGTIVTEWSDRDSGTIQGSIDDLIPHDDERWPTACTECGYLFTDDDMWQVNQRLIYRAADGREWFNHLLPVGALLDAQWYKPWGAGPDGIALVCVLPPDTDGDTRGHWWHVDGPARGEGVESKPCAWTRTGDPRADPPTVDVNPSILTPDYHGYLRNGVLTDPV